MHDQLSETMRDTWDTLARTNAMHYIATERQQWEQEEFLRSGRETVRALLKAVNHQPRGVVLDLGCGIGRLSLALAEQFEYVYGIDVSPEMIERANQLTRELGYTNVQFRANNGLDFAFIPSNTCDLGFSYIVLQHIPDPRIVLGYVRELARVVKPSGHVLFQVPVYQSTPLVIPWRIVQSLFRVTQVQMEKLNLVKPEKRLAFRGSRLTMNDLRTLMARSGLELISTQQSRSSYRFCHDVIVYAVKR